MHIILAHPRLSNSYGGTETRCFTEASWFLKQGHSVTIFHSVGEVTYEWNRFLDQHYNNPLMKSFAVDIGDLSKLDIEEEFYLFSRAASPFFSSLHPDIVVVYYSSMLQFLDKGVKYIFRSQGNPSIQALKAGAKHLGDNLCAIIAVSRSLYPILEDSLKNCWNGTLIVLNGGINIPKIHNDFEKTIDVLFLGRLIERKDPETLCLVIKSLLFCCY